ncbi:hypothetical protein [Rhodoplanes sp. Z2-YC6860]|uniref:hypothetical protein n=1 Tax=Rhodoplanes sp. Z2-YC6860 TaxID=674703 RepID=UPI00082A3EA2|nr:hypothetical protein [Rhodoplanes sp. Z2-YC6860]
MLRRFFHSQFAAKLFCELLPATIASAIGAYLINNYFKPPAPQPQSNAELVQIMREQQALLADYLKKSTEAHQRADQAVAQETDKLKTAERDAIQALREAKAAELRALAAAVTRAGEASERKLAKAAAGPATVAALPAQWPQIDRAQTERPRLDKSQTERAMASEPLQLHQAVTTAPLPPIAAQGPVQAQPQIHTQAAVQQTDPSAEPSEHGVVAKVKSTVSTLERLPSRMLNWFSDTVVPPRPPVDLPPRQFMKAAM